MSQLSVPAFNAKFAAEAQAAVVVLRLKSCRLGWQYPVAVVRTRH